MPATDKTASNPFLRPYKPFPDIINGGLPNQCVPAIRNTPDWKQPQYDYGASSRYGQTYLSQGPLQLEAAPENKAWKYAKKAKEIFEKIEKAYDQGEKIRNMPQTLDTIKQGVISRAKMLRPYTFIETADEILEDVPIRAWVRELDGPTEEVLMNIGVMQITAAMSIIEPTRFTAALDKLEASLVKCLTKAQEIIGRFLAHVEKISKAAKLDKLKNTLRLMLEKWPRITNAITHTFKRLKRLMGPAGMVFDVHDAWVYRESYEADPSSEEKRKKYVISVISVATDVIAEVLLKVITKHPIGFCVAAIYIAYSVKFSLDGGEGELGANILYNHFPETITGFVMMLDSYIVQICQQAVIAESIVSDLVADAKAVAKAVGEDVRQIGKAAVQSGAAVLRSGETAANFSEELYARFTSDPAN